jgi:hypothetical protein
VAILGVGLLLPNPNASASFIIDNFDDADFTVDAGTGPRTDNNLSSDFGSVDRTVTATGLGSITLDGAGLVTTTLSAAGAPFFLAASVQLDYHFDAAGGADLHSSGLSRFLQVPFSSDISGTGTYTLTVSYQGIGGGGYLSFTPRVIGATGDGLQVFDGHDLGNGAVASAVEDLRILLSMAAPGSGTIALTMDNDNFDLQAVPEPGTIALLGMSSIGAFGLVFLRRRKATS